MEISGQCQQLIHCTDILVFMSGDLAIATSVPIHAVVAAVPIATDDVGRLFPGQGVLALCLLCHEESFWSTRSNLCLPLLTTLHGQNQ